MSSGSGFGAPGLDPAVYEQRGGRLGGGPRGMYERYHQVLPSDTCIGIAS